MVQEAVEQQRPFDQPLSADAVGQSVRGKTLCARRPLGFFRAGMPCVSSTRCRPRRIRERDARASGWNAHLPWVVLWALLVLPAVAWCQEATAPPAELLTLEQAVDMALAHNRQVNNAALEVQKASDGVAAARTQRLPTLNLNLLGVSRLASEDYTFKAGQLGTFPTTGPIPATDTKIPAAKGETGLLVNEVTQPLSQQYRIGLGIKRLEVLTEIATQDLQAQRQKVAHDVKQAYYDVLQTQSALAATEETLTFVRELDGLVDRHVQEKTALKFESLEVKTRLAKAEHEGFTQRNALATQKERLNDLLGRDVQTAFRVTAVPDMPDFAVDLTAAQAEAQKKRPELHTAQLKVQQAEYDVRIKRAEYIPDLSAVLYYARPLHVDFVPSEIVYAGVQFKWEFFDWGRKQQELAERGRALAQARNDMREAQAQVEIDVNTRVRALREARSLLHVTQLAQETAREKLRFTLDRYKQQAALLPDALQAQAALADANHQYQQALLSFWKARADLEKSLGEE
jgi:outer membrane protein TolC